jgi:hypothetical protein
MSLWSNRASHRSLFLLPVLLGMLCLLVSTAARADTTIAGSIEDLVTGSAVGAASVTVHKGGESIGITTSGNDGSFHVLVSLPARPEPQNLKLIVHRDGYAEASRDVVVVSGRTDANTYKVVLERREVVDCRQSRDHGVAVGYFRPPAAGSADMDMAGRIRDALSYDLLTRVQQSRLRPESQPFIWACPGARPQVEKDYVGWAKALNADAFIAGYVAPAGQRFKVEMLVADRFSAANMLTRTTSKDVDLDDPAAARMDASAHTAILAALLSGYHRSAKYAECIEMCVAAERILGRLPPALEVVRSQCQAQLPNRGLVPGGS